MTATAAIVNECDDDDYNAGDMCHVCGDGGCCGAENGAILTAQGQTGSDVCYRIAAGVRNPSVV